MDRLLTPTRTSKPSTISCRPTINSYLEPLSRKKHCRTNRRSRRARPSRLLLSSRRANPRARLIFSRSPENMPIAESIAALRSANRPVPKPMRLPTPEEVASVEEALRIRFHPDFRAYLLLASDVVFGTLEPVTITLPGSHTDLRRVARSAQDLGVPKGWLPVCEDNGDYFCVTPDGEEKFWSHNGTTEECWRTLSDWIDKVWLKS